GWQDQGGPAGGGEGARGVDRGDGLELSPGTGRGRQPRHLTRGAASRSVKALGQFEIWLVAGSQDLYGEDALAQVEAHARTLAESLDAEERIPVRVVAKPVLRNAESIRALCLDANAEPACVGLVAWMHTFSPAKMWIAGLAALQKPLLHLHTQFERDLPWAEIDMDFMNLHQSAHGDREFGFLETRMRCARKTVVGHWPDPEAAPPIPTWPRP